MQLVRSGSSWSGNERNCAFLNCMKPRGEADAVPRFANISAISGLDFPDDARGLAVVDWDQDGDLDLLFRNRTSPRIRIMRNRTSEIGENAGFVAVRLKGTTCNLDAVGARAELVLENAPDGNRLVQSVRVGDGFLSQSSRILHFGLGKQAAIQELVVDWPGGERETFTGIENGGRYEVVEGAGQARRVAKPNRAETITLGEQPYESFTPTLAARVVLPAKIALPTLTLSYDDDNGVPGAFQPNANSTLITFWSSSCPNCREELTAFTENQDQLRKAQLDVLAICLDGLGQSQDPSVMNLDGKKFLDQIDFPFSSANPTSESIERIRHFQDSLFNKHPPFVVPLSFLVDSTGRIVSIYRGSFSVDVFIADLELSDLSDETRRSLATPVRGSWFTKPATSSQVNEYIGKRLFSRAPEEGLRYYELAMNTEQGTERRTQLQQQIVRTYLALAKSSTQQESRASRYFESAVRIAPGSPQVHFEYGLFLARQNQLQKAEEHFRIVLRLNPGHAGAERALALLRNQKVD